MGGCFGRSSNIADLEEKDASKKNKDTRRRNSLAFNIASFVQYEEEDYKKLIDQAKAETGKKKKQRLRAADASKICLFNLLFILYLCFNVFLILTNYI